ncbi:hypothetical protein PENTCL1PPCAC_15528, partial [Pristionchus entomophagus]
RARHQMIFNSLTAQMFLPLVSVVACLAWAVDYLEIVRSTWLQRSTVVMSSSFALGAPLINLYFLRPYRRDDTVHITLFAILDCAALLANMVLIVAVITSTPRILKAYSVLLLNTAVVDSCSAIFSVAAVCRFVGQSTLFKHYPIFSMQSVNGTLYFNHAGPCTLLGPRFCHRSVFLQAAFISHSTVLLFVSFSYRLWMLGRSSLTNFGQPRIRNMCLIALMAAVPSAFLFVIMQILNDAAATYDGCPRGTVCSKLVLAPVSAKNILAPTAFALLITAYSVEFLCVFRVRHSLLKRIQKINSPEGARHQMIFNSLTAQMLLPCISIVGCVAFAVDFLEILQSTWLQRSVILVGSTMALGAPLVNLYFLRPYRK